MRNDSPEVTLAASSQRRWRAPSPYAAALLLLLSCSLGLAGAFRLAPEVLRSTEPRLWTTMAVLALLLLLPAWLLLDAGLRPRLALLSPRVRAAWVLGALAAGALLVVAIPLEALRSGAAPERIVGSRTVNALLTGAEFASLALLVLTGGVLLGSWQGPRAQPPRSPWPWWVASVACAAVWTTYLLAFWPGLMTVDSFVQWAQIHGGQLDNAHPAFHTLLMRLLTRLWSSPASVASMQVLALALVFGRTLVELGRWGVPGWVRVLLTVLFALSPVNGTMIVTLWKDVPYSIAYLALFTLFLQLARTRAEALRSLGFLLELGCALTVIALLRHNGTASVVLMLGFLVIGAPRPLRSRAVWVAVGTLAMFVLVTQPLYRLFEVRAVPRAFAHAIQIHQMGAMAHAAPEQFSAEERGLLESLQPWEVWRDNYNCFSVTPQLHNGKLRWGFFETEGRHTFLQLWRRLLPANVRPLLEHQACVSALVWKIRPQPSHIWIFHLDMDPNAFGLVQEPRLPRVNRWLRQLLARTQQPDLEWWVWRPALALYLGLFFVLVVATRLRSAWALAPLVPILSQSLVLALVNVSPDFRYQYPVYLMAWVSAGWLFAPRASGSPAPRAAPVTP